HDSHARNLPACYLSYRRSGRALRKHAGAGPQNGSTKEGGPTMRRSLSEQSLRHHREEATGRRGEGPVRTRAGRLNEVFARWISNSALGGAFGQWLSKTIALPQLRRLTGAGIPWTPLHRPVSDSTVVLVSTGGVHL